MATEVFFFQNKSVEIKRRAFKRSIGLTLEVSGKISVSAPKTVPLRKIEQFLEKNRIWIRSNLEKYEILRRRYPKKLYRIGEEFPFLGERLRLEFDFTKHRRIYFTREAGRLVCHLPQERSVGFDPEEEHPELASALLKFYEGEGRAQLEARIKFLSEKIKLYPKAVSYRSQKTRWGSCSSQGKLSFNWRLIIAPSEVVDYVVVHELAHLKFHNHSENFWNLVGEHCPQYRVLKDWLNQNQFEADFLSRDPQLYPGSKL